MKKLTVVAAELREQVEEATDPKDPKRLPQYTASLRDGIDSLVPMLTDDPTMAALAFHNQIRFDDQSVLNGIVDRDMASEGDWPLLKRAIQMRPDAHKAVKTLEQAGLEAVLVTAVVANFKLKQLRRAQREALEEQEEFQNVE